MKKNFDIHLTDPQAFIGPNDKNIKLVENYFSTGIVIRGNTIKLDGKTNEINIISKIFNNMINIIETKGHLEEDDVKDLITTTTPESKLLTEDLINKKIILHTYKGVVYAKTNGQKKYLDAVNNHDITFSIGPAGTGKTYQAVACAVAALKNNIVNKIVITRPAVEAGESLGFLPGDLKEKIDPYLTPIYDALNEMIEKEKLKTFIDNRMIEIAPLAYMRGRTLHNAFIILDEAQNATTMQMKMFLTRLGVTSKAIITGDLTQIDLPKKNLSGLIEAINILKNIDGIGYMEFNSSDVVRHTLVKDIINAYAKNEKAKDAN
jgi:phosphate starvation-inducible protein PhoH and related proteins